MAFLVLLGCGNAETSSGDGATCPAAQAECVESCAVPCTAGVGGTHAGGGAPNDTADQGGRENSTAPAAGGTVGAETGTGGALQTGGSNAGGSNAGGSNAGGAETEIQFDPNQPEETRAGMPYDPYPNGVVVTKVMHFGNSCWKIAAAGGTFYFETGETDGKSGFSSAFDQAGNDWIGNDADRGDNTSPSTGGRHEFRGWPNFGEGNFDHPQRSSGTSTRWVDEAGNEATFESGVLKGTHLILRSENATYELEYHFFSSHAAIKILRADDKYAFLYEGPLGGEQDDNGHADYYVLEDGVQRDEFGSGLGYIDPEFGNRFPSSFLYFGDPEPGDTQVWYFGVKDTAPESAGDEGWKQGDNMVIFSFGRDDDKRAYTGTDATCVFGFYSRDAEHTEIASFIKARIADPFTDADVTGVIPAQ